MKRISEAFSNFKNLAMPSLHNKKKRQINNIFQGIRSNFSKKFAVFFETQTPVAIDNIIHRTQT